MWKHLEDWKYLVFRWLKISSFERTENINVLRELNIWSSEGIENIKFWDINIHCDWWYLGLQFGLLVFGEIQLKLLEQIRYSCSLPKGNMNRVFWERTLQEVQRLLKRQEPRVHKPPKPPKPDSPQGSPASSSSYWGDEVMMMVMMIIIINVREWGWWWWIPFLLVS